MKKHYHEKGGKYKARLKYFKRIVEDKDKFNEINNMDIDYEEKKKRWKIIHLENKIRDLKKELNI